ncbi:Rho termination factor N-terminal domain-containing protein, partial [Streptomyces sp. 2A115]|uniref:Rho termination factor N-terminal domain-containing protein n=1 Tax=Streptomyces sp. 2A115 TaxID=3457439 RepID=UPI003FD5CFDE
MSDTTDLMGARVEETAAAPATDASAPATGAGSRRRRGTGLDGMVLAELQQVASGLGIRGTARMRKSQLIEVIKEAQAGGGTPAKTAAPAADATETKPKRRATSKARTGTSEEAAPPAAKAADKKADPAEKAVAQQQIEIPGQPASEDAPAERRRRRATAEAGSPETVAAEAKSEPKAEVPVASGEAKGDAGDGGADGRQGRRDRRDRDRDR